MLKKIATLVIATITICSFVGCTKKTDNRSANALNTIETILEKDVEVEESNIKLSKSFGGCLVNDDKPYEEAEGYMLWMPEIKLKESQKMLFLFKDNKKGILATESPKDYNNKLVIDSSYIDDINNKNYVSGAFAWENKGYAQAILNYKADYVVSSIWIYETSEDKVFQIWENQIT